MAKTPEKRMRLLDEIGKEVQKFWEGWQR
jgi:hypothetical protein